jgi:hypothetical protein
MKKTSNKRLPIDLKHQGAYALLAAIFQFLQGNNIDAESIIEFTKNYHAQRHRGHSPRKYQELLRIYDDMGVIMATWFSDPRFLDKVGRPLPLSLGSGLQSLSHLIRVSGANVKVSTALELMRLSPSVRMDNHGNVLAQRRVFVLPKFDVPRAAFVVERYLDTVVKNVVGRKMERPLLLERTCYVSKADLTRIGATLRDIDARGTAFMDSIDGEIEELRLRRAGRKSFGELGVQVFAWIRPESGEKSRHARPFATLRAKR